MTTALLDHWPMIWRGLAAAGALGLFGLLLAILGRADGFAADANDGGEGREPVEP